MKQMRWWVALVLVLLGLVTIRAWKTREKNNSLVSGIVTPTVEITKVSTQTSSPPATTKPQPTKTAKNPMNIPFYVQAPYAVWDALHEEACEEASLLMTYYWLTDQKPKIAEFDQDQKHLISWEANHGYGLSISIAQLHQVATDYFHINTSVLELTTSDQLRQIITTGTPVILPADGKLLKNPQYSHGGPVYHMLVIKGYEAGKFVTNDSGTKWGENYRYDPDILINALGNWDGSSVDRSNHRVLLINQ